MHSGGGGGGGWRLITLQSKAYHRFDLKLI